LLTCCRLVSTASKFRSPAPKLNFCRLSKARLRRALLSASAGRLLLCPLSSAFARAAFAKTSADTSSRQALSLLTWRLAQAPYNSPLTSPVRQAFSLLPILHFSRRNSPFLSVYGTRAWTTDAAPQTGNLVLYIIYILMTQNPVTIADPKVASGNGIIDDLATPQPQPNQSAPGSDGSPIRRRLRYGAPSRILGRDGVSDEALAKAEALAKSGPRSPTATLPSTCVPRIGSSSIQSV